MPTNPHDIRARLAAFVSYRAEHLDGDEKSEAQIFLERFFQAFGHDGIAESGARLEERIRLTGRAVSFADFRWSDRCIIEMKKAGTDLKRHYRQAFEYWIGAVPNRPRYVVLCNFDEFWIYDFDVQLDAPVDKVAISDLISRHEALSFMLPIERAPIFGNDLEAVTRRAAADVSGVFRSMRARGVDRLVAQRFVLQSVVAMFSEDIGLLPEKFFTRAVNDAQTGTEAYDLVGNLFIAMNTTGDTTGGRYVGTPYFNGGLFANVEPVELTDDELRVLRAASTTNWSDVRPEIFGTLFEQSMDEGERHAYGAHFTSPVDIAKVVFPTIVKPWMDRIATAASITDLELILLDMASFRVLDPACGSGNFLYIAYREMRRLEHEVKAQIDDRRRSGDIRAQTALSYVTPDHFLGIDSNPFAVEVAKVTMTLAKKLCADELDETQDVLPLDNLDASIVSGDALFVPWPHAHAIIGNPPYIGRRKMADELGLGYIQRLAQRYPAVGGVSDFVTYWFRLANDALRDGDRAGLVATQAIRDGGSRVASLDYVSEHDGVIYDAVSSQGWSGEAAVTVSIVNWVKGHEHAPDERILWLDGGDLRLPLAEIPPTLRPDTDVSRAVPLALNKRPKVCFQGQTTGHVAGYELTRAEARRLIREHPGSADVIFPLVGGDSMLKTLKPDRFIIDVPDKELMDAEFKYPAVMRHLREHALPHWLAEAEKEESKNAALVKSNPNGRPVLVKTQFLNSGWWRHWRRREEMLEAYSGLDRYIALTIVAAKDRLSVYQFVDASIRPNALLQVFAFEDDYSFGVLSSGVHRAWFDERCSRLESRPRYTPTTVWDSFPWPPDPQPQQVASVAAIVAEIIDLREIYTSRGATLTKQYNALRQPGASRLRDLHAALDSAVLACYNFSPDDDLLAQLLALNFALSEDPAQGRRPGPGDLSGAHSTTWRLRADPLVV